MTICKDELFKLPSYPGPLILGHLIYHIAGMVNNPHISDFSNKLRENTDAAFEQVKLFSGGN